MFTLESIEWAHSKVQSWADFPAYIQEFKKLGVLSYSIYVCDGHARYEWSNNYVISSPAAFQEKKVNTKLDLDTFKEQLHKHQQWQTDYPTFCNDAAWSGIMKRVMDLENMKCHYYNTSLEIVVSESIAH